MKCRNCDAWIAIGKANIDSCHRLWDNSLTTHDNASESCNSLAALASMVMKRGMAVQTLDRDAAFSLVQNHTDVTQSRLEANPLTAALAAPFADFRKNRFVPTFLASLVIDYAVAQGRAQVFYTDTVLNGLVQKLDHALLILVKNDRSAPLYQKYFGQQRPSDVVAPLLGPQLETMRDWISSLLAQPHASLQAIGAEIKAAVAAADAAVQVKKGAEGAQSDFAQSGDRAQMIDAYNALRKSTFGKLGEIQHQNPQLPTNFPDTFFLHEMRKRDDKLSAEQIQGKIDAMKEDLATWQKKLEKAQAREQAEADEKAQQAAAAAALADKRKQAEALAAEIKKLEGEVAGK